MARDTSFCKVTWQKLDLGFSVTDSIFDSFRVGDISFSVSSAPFLLYTENFGSLKWLSSEASPLSTLAEIEVGKQLSEMFGYNINASDEAKNNTPSNSGPEPWGHVTCDGTIANLESMW